MREGLDRLIAAVEGGTWDGSWRWLLDNIWNIDQCQPFSDAYHGSLDAAKALHEALLPSDWIADVDTTGFAMVYQDEMEVSNNATALLPGLPARAWLLAILRAYRAQRDGQP